MIDEKFALAIGRCIQKYSHAINVDNHAKRYQVDYRSDKICSISKYIEHLCQSILFDNPLVFKLNKQHLLKKMFSAYNDIVSCYQITIEKAIEQVMNTISQYKSTVINNSNYRPGTGETLNIQSFKEQLNSWSDITKNFEKYTSITDGILAEDWSDHLSPFENCFSELSKMNKEMTAQIEVAESQIKDTLRLWLMKAGIIIAAFGACVTIATLAVKVFSR